MSRRDPSSRVKVSVRRRIGSVAQKKESTRRRGDGGTARYATVSAAAALVVLAPLAAGASKPWLRDEPVAPRPPAATMSADDAVRFGSAPTVGASLPWLTVARNGTALPASFVSTLGSSGTGAIPPRVRQAYVSAETSLAAAQPGCRLPWWLLAGIGYVESGHAAGGQVDAAGRTTGEIFGPRLDGTTPDTATIADSDQGSLDLDADFDRAVGPMQFLPSTWRAFGADGNGDGVADPHNVDDAALSAGNYLCSGGGDLGVPAAVRTAILRYNPSDQYVAHVLGAGQAYRDGRTPPPAWIPPTRDATAPTPPVVVADPPVGGVVGPDVVGPGAAPDPSVVADSPVPTRAPSAAPRRATPVAPAPRSTRTTPASSAPSPSTSPTTSPTPSTAPSPTSTRPPTRPTPAPTASPSLPVCEGVVPDPSGSPMPEGTSPSATTTSPGASPTSATAAPSAATTPAPSTSPTTAESGGAATPVGPGEAPAPTPTPTPTPTCVVPPGFVLPAAPAPTKTSAPAPTPTPATTAPAAAPSPAPTTR